MTTLKLKAKKAVFMRSKIYNSVNCFLILGLFVCGGTLMPAARALDPVGAWKIGEPITTYWAGPPLTDAVATQMGAGGWNLVWCREDTLDVAQRHGLRAYLTDPLLTPASLDDEKTRSQLDALLGRVKNHPALYAYHIKGELGVSSLPDWARLVRYIRERDSLHAIDSNLYPSYAKNRQLGVSGDNVSAYREYLRKFIEIIKPEFLSYAHYNFKAGGDRDEYFQNLSLIRQAAVGAGLSFVTIVQASAWKGAYRVPTGEQLRWLAYTSLAYGAQGISYYVYSIDKASPHDGYKGGMAHADGTPTPLYWAASKLNREFVAVASQLQGLKSIGAFHAGMVPPGAIALPNAAAIWVESPVSTIPYKSGHPVDGFVLGYFGGSSSASPAEASHVLVVNLDYKHSRSIKVAAREPLSVFDAEAGNWNRVADDHIELSLPAGGGRLLRIAP